MKDATAESWPMVSLGEICQIEMGRTPARKNAAMWDPEKATDNVWLSIADLPMDFHATVYDSKEYVSDAAAANMRLIPAGTLLASFKLTLGRLAFSGRDLYSNEAIASLLNIDEERLLKPFLYWALTAFDWDNAAEADHKVKGKTLNKSKLQQIPIPLPPLEDQRRIVAILDKAFEGITRARNDVESQLCDLDELQQSILQQAFSGEWPIARLGSLASVRSGFAFKSCQWTDEGVPVVKIGNVKRGRLDMNGCSFITKADAVASGFLLSEGDILIGLTGYVGDVARVHAGENYALNQRVGKFFAKKEFDSQFLFFFLSSENFRRKVESVAHGAAQANVSPSAIEALELPIPPLSEQKRIVSILDKASEGLARARSNVETKLCDLDDLQQSILQRAFTGELTR